MPKLNDDELINVFQFATTASSLDLKKMFIKQRDVLDEETFQSLLYGCAWGGNVEGFSLTLKQMEKYNISIEQRDKNIIFNLALANHEDFAQSLDTNYQCSDDMIERYSFDNCSVNDEGVAEFSAIAGGPDILEWFDKLGQASKYFTLRVDTLMAKNNKTELFDYLIKTKKMNTWIANEIFFEATNYGNQNVVTELINNPETKDLLNWNKINKFLNDDDDPTPCKEKIKSLCEKIKLESLLPKKESVPQLKI